MSDLGDHYVTILVSLGVGVFSVVGTLLTTRSSRASTEETARSQFRNDLMTERRTLLEDVAKVQAAHDRCTADLADVTRRLSSAEQHIAVLRGSNEVMEKWVSFFKEQMPTRGVPTG